MTFGGGAIATIMGGIAAEATGGDFAEGALTAMVVFLNRWGQTLNPKFFFLSEFEKYRVVQDRLFVSDFDKLLLDIEENHGQ